MRKAWIGTWGSAVLVSLVACGGSGGKDGDGSDRCAREGRYGDGPCDTDCEQYDEDCDPGGTDPCREPNRYSDGNCDTDCLYPDQDCDGGRDPCINPDRYGDGPCDTDCERRDPDCDGGSDDACERELRYGDGPCDACPQYDSDCNPCGDETWTCAPANPDPCASGDTYGDGTCDACHHFDPDCYTGTLAPPSEVTASDGVFSDRVVVSWRPVAGALDYTIDRTPSGGSTATRLTSVPATVGIEHMPLSGNGSMPREGFTDSTATPGVVYAYAVVAMGAAGAQSIASQSELGHAADISSATLLPPTDTSADVVGPIGILLRWTPAVGAAMTQAYVSTSPGGLVLQGAMMFGTSGDEYYVSLNYPGTTLFFAFTSVDGDGNESVMSAPISATLETPPTLVPPSQVVATTDLVDRVVVGWQPVSGADWYRVYRSLDENGGYVAVSGAVSTTSFQDTGDHVEAWHYYVVRAFTAAGASSDFSGEAAGVAAAPSPPQDVTPTALGPTSVSVSWSVSSDAASYNVYRGDSFAPTEASLHANVTTTSYLDPDAPTDSTVYYFVSAVTVRGRESALSAGVMVRVPAWVEPPTGVVASVDLLDRVQLTWNAVTPAEWYRVYRDDPTVGFTDVSGPITATTFEDPLPVERLGLNVGYQVRAFTSAHSSRASDTAMGRALRIDTPDGFGATAGATALTTTILLSWDPVAGADHYAVYRSNEPMGTFGFVGLTVDTETTFEDATVELGFIYWYRVAAVSAAGTESQRSFAVDGATDAITAYNAGNYLPGPPWVSVSYDSVEGDFDVTWGGVANAGSFVLARGEMIWNATTTEWELAGTFLSLGRVTGTSASDPAPGIQCVTYLVTSVRTDGLESVFSNLADTTVCRP